jgi:hypothetical protein
MDNFPLVIPNQGFSFPCRRQSTVYNLNPDVTIPYIQQWTFGLGWQFGNDCIKIWITQK